MRFVALLVCAGVLGGSARSHACERTGPPFAVVLNILGVSIPAAGTRDVPLNATPFVRGADFENGEVPILREEGGDVVEFALQTLTVVRDFDGLEERLLHLKPLAPLSPFTTYEVVRKGLVHSTFTTGDTVDTEAPQPPTLGDPVPSDMFEEVNVSVEAEEPLVVGAIGADPVVEDGARISGATAGDQLVAFGPVGPIDLRVVAVDVAGNVSPSARVQTEVIPSRVTPAEATAACNYSPPLGCSASRGLESPMAMLLLLAFSRPKSSQRRPSKAT